MSNQVTPIPEGYHSITPYLIVPDGAKAVAFYEKVFGAKPVEIMAAPDGSVRHAELQIGDSMLMLGQHDDIDPRGEKSFPRVSIYLYVDDADRIAALAKEGGSKELFPVTQKFYGNREGGYEDPFGIVWWIATRVEKVSSEEMERRAAAAGQPQG